MNKKFAFSILVMSVFISLVKAEDPLETTKQDEIEEINNLYDKIAGTTWIHHYKSGKFPFTFGTNGVIENHKTWKGTPWRVVSSTEVILGKKEGKGKMIFTFDKKVESFENLDWDGTPTSGKISRKKNSN